MQRYPTSTRQSSGIGIERNVVRLFFSSLFLVILLLKCLVACGGGGEAVLCGRAKAERTADRERLVKGETLNAGSGKLKTGQRQESTV